MKFLVDAQLPPALARWLSAQGHHAEHVSDCGLDRAPDSEIWRHAARVGAVIVTKDEDFAQRKVLDAGGPQVVWLRIPNTRRRDLLARVERALPRLVEALERAEALVEVV